MGKSQKAIHKLDLSGKSVSPVLQMDMFLSDLQEQIQLISEADKADFDEMVSLRIFGMKEYIRGYRDGNRYFRLTKGGPLGSREK